MNVLARVRIEKEKFSFRIWIASRLLQFAEWILSLGIQENMEASK